MTVFPKEVREHLQGKRPFTCPVVIDGAEQRSDGGLALRGHAAVFYSDSEPIFGMFIERIARGAFRKVLGTNPDVRFQFNHDGQPIARTKNGTLRLREDTTGLAFEADIADTTLGRDVHKLVERGDLDQMSFAFTVEADKWNYATGDDFDERTILEIRDLFEISVVPFPAYTATEVVATAPAASNTDEPRAGTDPQQDSRGDSEQPTVQGGSEANAPEERTAVDEAQRNQRMREIDLLRRRIHECTSRTARGDSQEA